MDPAAADVTSAVRKGLADYLRGYLEPLLGIDAQTGSPTFGQPLVTVREEWPRAQERLNQHDVTVLSTGEADDWSYYPPVTVAVEPIGPVDGVVTMTYGIIEGLQLDLDCFATTSTKRNALLGILQRALNRPPSETIAALADPTARRRRERAAGLTLRLASLFDTDVQYEFSPVSSPVENADAAQVSEWRAHLRGKATLTLRDQQVLPLIKRINLTLDTGAVSKTVVVTPT